jgi:hypothetical protein
MVKMSFVDFLLENHVLELDMIELRRDEKGEDIAGKLDVEFIGWQPGLNKYLFKDSKGTGSSFTAKDFEEAELKLNRNRLKYKRAELDKKK